MKKIRFIFFLFLSCVSFSLNAQECINDIWDIGLNANSLIYSGEKGNRRSELASSTAAGIRLSRIIYCPENKIEFAPYLTYQRIEFKDAQKINYFRGVTEKLSLITGGLELGVPFRLSEFSFEVPIDFEVRQDMAFYKNIDYLASKNYINIKLMSGIRKKIWKAKTKEITGELKLGILYGVSHAADLGLIYKLNGQYYQKISESTSLKLDFFFTTYNQKFDQQNMSINDLGISSSFVFRFWP